MVARETQVTDPRCSLVVHFSCIQYEWPLQIPINKGTPIPSWRINPKRSTILKSSKLTWSIRVNQLVIAGVANDSQSYTHDSYTSWATTIEPWSRVAQRGRTLVVSISTSRRDKVWAEELTDIDTESQSKYLSLSRPRYESGTPVPAAHLNLNRLALYQLSYAECDCRNLISRSKTRSHKGTTSW